MEKVSQIGEELKKKSKEKEQQLQTEFRESLQRLEENLITLSDSKLTAIESDMAERAEQIEEFGKKKIQRLVNANHKFYKEMIQDEKEEWTEEHQKWRKLLLYLLPIALMFGLISGSLSTLYLSQPKALTVSESEIVKSEDGTAYLPITKIPNLEIMKSKDK